MKKEINLKCIIRAGVFLYLLPFVVSAQMTGSPKGSGKLDNPIKAKDLLSLINLLIDGLMKVGLVAAACFIIYSGFLFVSARGEPGKITEAKKNFFWTIIGTAVILGAKVIVAIITGTLKSF